MVVLISILSDGMVIFQITGGEVVILIDGMVIFQITGGEVVILIGGDPRPDVCHCELRNDGVHALHGVWCVHAAVGEDSHFESDIVRRFFLAAVHARVLMEIFLEVFLGHLYRIDPCLQ